MVGQRWSAETKSELDILQNKQMVSAWWSGDGIIHYSFMKLDQLFTRCLLQPSRWSDKGAAITQPKLVYRGTLIRLQDNARPHAAQTTLLDLETFCSHRIHQTLLTITSSRQWITCGTEKHSIFNTRKSPLRLHHQPFFRLQRYWHTQATIKITNLWTA